MTAYPAKSLQSIQQCIKLSCSVMLFSKQLWCPILRKQVPHNNNKVLSDNAKGYAIVPLMRFHDLERAKRNANVRSSTH
eukprot:2445211-Amphidinium_carterae.1